MNQFSLGPALLFCPADRPDRYEKAIARADGVILDLEDAVAPGHRRAARAALVANPLDPARVIVRVNPCGTPDADDDLAALRQTDYRTIMLTKASPDDDLTRLHDFSVIALCETAYGIINAGRIAAGAPVNALMWGAEDLVVSMGGTSSRRPDGRYRDVVAHARATVALAAAAQGIAMIDSVHLDVKDHEGLAAEARDAAALGFAATACIHPSQVEVIRTAYRPSDTEVIWARKVIDAVAHAGAGVVQVDAEVVDEPVVHHARSIVRRAEARP